MYARNSQDGRTTPSSASSSCASATPVRPLLSPFPPVHHPHHPLPYAGYTTERVTVPNVVSANAAYAKVQSAISSFYQNLSNETINKPGPAFQSATVSLLASEARADQLMASGPPTKAAQRPLRLLSIGKPLFPDGLHDVGAPCQ